jgi:alkylhydroperoxidase/carboxymuconolactone decarboxylase family protein YurZ
MALTDKDRRLVRVFSALVLGEFDEAKRVRRDAPAPEPDREWRETVRQVHLFAGFPRLVESLEAMAQAGGLGTSGPDEGDERGDGAALFDTIYGANAAPVRARLAELDATFAEWVADHAYARILTRPGLSAARRELLAVAALAALGQERQLASHTRGAVHCGAEREDALEVLDVIRDLVPVERMQRVQLVVERFACVDE